MNIVEQAIARCGGRQQLAQQLGVTPQAIHHFLRQQRFPTRRVLAVEKATGISRSEIDPGLYPWERS
jgi:DNA-binding transcriptional regulator YdaS (Cro superfamily)